MARLIKTGNVVFFEYPSDGLTDPFFSIDKNDGALWIDGYSMSFAGNKIRVAKRFEVSLKDYTAIGVYEAAKNVVEGDIESILTKYSIKKESCLILIWEKDKPHFYTTSDNDLCDLCGHPEDDDFHFRNGGIVCDTPFGHCACGAFHIKTN